MTSKKRSTAIHQVDRRSVANPVQFRTILREVPECGRSGQRLAAFYGLMYFAALRPEEARNLRRRDLDLPPRTWNEEQQCWEVRDFGEIHLSRAAPEIGAEWTDSGQRNEERGLKHRADDEERTAPCPPELALLLHDHIDRYGIGPDGLLFVAERGGRVNSSTYSRVWALAREKAFTPEVVASPLAKRPYDLRHACVTLWLSLIGDPPWVAAWAGHSLHVLLRVYAKCIDGGEEAARQLLHAGLNAA